MKYLAALSILIASFNALCVAQLNPGFVGYTSNATITLVNYPPPNAVNGLPPSAGTISGSVYSRDCPILNTRQKGSLISPNGTTGSITFGGYAFSGTTATTFAQYAIPDGTMVDLILDVSASADMDLGIWWTVSHSSPCVARYHCSCGTLCLSYTYYYDGVTCTGTASTSGLTSTTIPAIATRSGNV